MVQYGLPYSGSGIHAMGASAETITTFIDSLTLEQYHCICNYNLVQYRHFDLSASTTVSPGAVYRRSNDQVEDWVEIAFLPSVEAPILLNWMTSGGDTGEIMPNGGTRFRSGDVINSTSYLQFGMSAGWDTWLTQANHIFHRLNIMSNFDDYGTAFARRDSSEGFLFLCPKEDFRTGSSSHCWPTYPAYWSLDPSGTERLSWEEATQLGFPSFKLTANAYGRSWDASVYEGLRQFHEAKGFDPYSQDVARHLGRPLYELSSQADTFTYVDSDFEEFDADIDSDCNSAYTENYESEYPLTQLTDLAADAEAMHHEKNVHDLADKNCGSEHEELSNFQDHDASQSTLAEDLAAEEIFVPSPTFRIVLYIQLTLISFLALSGVHHHVW
ncbi:hypothetical protein MSAN_02134100 [Mycena sanguinolenta]|uniref:Uncharacterized protein n=1 Tax=Mycena sanguinolenta TaxID=230812 RepID=A0A8H6XFR1_9AGAR|nr:hypothetical protein MSAN_02134100 [Mycena sanguinolenta]